MAIDPDKRATAWKFSTDGATATFSDTLYNDLVMGVWKILSVGGVLSPAVIERDVINFGSGGGNAYAIS